MPPPRKDPSREKVLRGIAVTVTAVWVLATLVQVADPSRQVPTTVNAIMGLVVTALFGASAIRGSRRNGNGNGGNGA